MLVRNRPTPGTPIAKSASFFSANSLTCRGVMICSASSFRSSGLTGGISRALQLAVEPDRRGPTDLEEQIGGVPLDHLGDGLLEIEASRLGGRRRFGLSHWDRPGRAPGRTRPAGVLHQISRTTPAISASISFMIFIASMMHTVWPG